MARAAARRISVALRAVCGLGAVGAMAGAAASLAPACYSGGGGTAPPPNTFYYPAGLQVSAGGHVLYAANSDFDLQWNGGTLQSYDLASVRSDAAALVQANYATANGGAIPAGNVWGSNSPPTTQFPWLTGCLTDAQVVYQGNRVPLGEACAPPVDSTQYRQDSAIIGAFATDIALIPLDISSTGPTRMFVPVRGDDTITWADLAYDTPNVALPTLASLDASTMETSPYRIQCGQDSTLVCDGEHHTNATVPGNTRQETLPGEPFGIALTSDGTAIAVTALTEPMTALLLSGFNPPAPAGVGTDDGGEEGNAGASADAGASSDAGAGLDAGDGGGLTDAVADQGVVDATTTNLDAAAAPSGGLPTINEPTMQFVLNGVPNNGQALVPVPHDIDAFPPPCESLPANTTSQCVRPAFLETFDSAAEVDLLRYYNDDGSSLGRPYLLRESTFSINVNQVGTNSRGIAIDTSPRIACKQQAGPNASQAALRACGELPARVFFANRTPPSLIVGEIGEPSANGDGSYNPDQLTLLTSVPLLQEPSRVYLAPIINATGQLVLRVFVVNYDSSTIQILDPSDPDLALVDTLYVGAGPFAMAFDPFDLNDVVQSSLNLSGPAPTPVSELTADPSVSQPSATCAAGLVNPSTGCLSKYRFAYVASFTDSYVQVIDLDARSPTFEAVVYNLGYPTPPKGTQ
jgi:hypothetical protein